MYEDDPNELGALIARYNVKTWRDMDHLSTLQQVKASAHDPDVQRAIFRNEMRAQRIRHELGDAEIACRVKASRKRFDG